jgi:spermidine synthase
VVKKYLSYLYPITIHREANSYSKVLEVTWVNGKLVLDSKHTNYSFGSLQRILRKGLFHIGMEQVKAMNEILVLGVAGGSVIDTLAKEFKVTGNITGIELDEKIMELSKQFFGLDSYDNLNLIHHEAFEFILRTQKKYDLIIIDIFQDTHMPGFLFETFFQFRLLEVLNPEGYIMFNTMILKPEDEIRNETYKKSWNSFPVQVQVIPKLEVHNELILIKKNQA